MREKDDYLTINNIPSLDDLLADPALAQALPIEVIDILLQEADETRKRAEQAKKVLVTQLQDRLANQIAAAFTAADKDYGTVHVRVDGYDVEVSREKRVEWDQTGLARLRDEIAGMGEDANDYVKVELKVEERKYLSWPKGLRRRQFEALRTTKPGTVGVKLSRLDETPAA